MSTGHTTAAERAALPNLDEVAESAADHAGVCKRLTAMRAVDDATGTVTYVGVPCKSTLSSVCEPCAKAARYLRMVQLKEGWCLAEEPQREKPEVTAAQHDLLGARAHLATVYQDARRSGDDDMCASVIALVAELDQELKDSGVRGPFPPLDPKPRRKAKSTRRRQDVPDLPRKKVTATTVGKQYAGKWRPSTFFTLTLPSYGGINEVRNEAGKMVSDGSPIDPNGYDYTRAARDAIHLKALFSRWMENLRRAVGWNVQYFLTVEPQKRGAPHLHIAMRGTVSHAILEQVTAATYVQIWWPHHDREVYAAGRMPVWDYQADTFTDPDTGAPLTSWDDALAVMDSVDELEPAHSLRFGAQSKTVQILAGSDEEERKVRYLTKYLTKSVSEVLEAGSVRVAVHYDRLHEELKRTPCSPACPVWLHYGIVPRGAKAKTIPGRCKANAHRRETLGLPGRRVLNSKQWTGKSVQDHRADRAEFVRQLLAAVGIDRPAGPRLRITPVRPGDKDAPPRAHLIIAAVAERSRWRAEYDSARLALAENPPPTGAGPLPGEGPPGPENPSAIPEAA